MVRILGARLFCTCKVLLRLSICVYKVCSLRDICSGCIELLRWCFEKAAAFGSKIDTMQWSQTVYTMKAYTKTHMEYIGQICQWIFKLLLDMMSVCINTLYYSSSPDISNNLITFFALKDIGKFFRCAEKFFIHSQGWHANSCEAFQNFGPPNAN